MEAVFKSIKCDTSLPVWVMDNTFSFTCDGSERCRFASGNVAQVSGKLILNGFYNYADEDTKVALVGGFETLTDRFQVDQVVDLCNFDKTFYAQGDDDNAAAAAGDDNNGDDADNDDGGNDDFFDEDAVYGDDDVVAQYNNGDDGANDDGANDDAAAGDDAAGDDAAAAGDDMAAGDDYYYDDANGDDANGDDAVVYNDYYNDDGNANRFRFLDDECPADGIYDFETSFNVPTSKWSTTGWGATADLKMFAHDGSKLGSCQVTFETRTTSPYILPAKFVFLSLVIASGLALFYVIYYLIKREALCGGDACSCGFEQYHDSNGDGVYKNMADDEEDFPTTDDDDGYSSEEKQTPKEGGVVVPPPHQRKDELDTGILA